MKAVYFKSPQEFRKWLQQHHTQERELLVGFHKVGSGKPSMSWPQSVDEALCFGWIDGVRKRVDDARYTIRFTPRRPSSIWSSINIKRVGALIEQRSMQPAGLRAFESRRENKSGIYSYEQRPTGLVAPYAAMLARNAAARKFFEGQAPSYRRAAVWWVISAKQEATRLKRANTLIALSAKGVRIPQFVSRPAKSRRG